MEKKAFDTQHIVKTYFKMATPVVIGLVITLIYNLADTYFIAQTGNTDLVAGVSICGPIFTFLMAFGNIYGQGGSSLISRLLGQNDEKGIRHASSFCFYVALLTGLVIGILLLILQNPVLTLIGANADTLEYAREYFVVMAIGSPLVVLAFIHSNLLRCEGKALESMIGNALGSIVNIILDPILIMVFKMGARGAAIATVIGYSVSDVFFLVLVLKKSHYLSVKFSEWKLNSADIRQIFGIGFTAAISNIMSSVAMILMNQCLLPYGNDRIAAMGIVMKITMIIQLVMTGFAFGGVPVFGFLYGSQDMKTMKKLISFCLKYLVSLALVMGAVLFFASSPMVSIFMDQENIVREGSLMLRLQVVGMPFMAVTLLLTVLFQASGKVIPALIMSLSRQGVVFIVVLLLLTWLFGYMGLLSSQLTADVVSAGMGLVLYLKIFKTQKQNGV